MTGTLTAPASNVDQLQQRLRKNIIDELEGTPPNRDELMAILFDLGWDHSRLRYDRLVQRIRQERFWPVQLAEKQQAASVELGSIRDQLSAIRAKCEAEVSRLKQAIVDAWQPLRDAEAETAARRAELEHLARPGHDEGSIYDRLIATADPALAQEIAALDQRKLVLSDEINRLREVAKPRRVTVPRNFRNVDVIEDKEFLLGEIAQQKIESEREEVTQETREAARRRQYAAQRRLDELEAAESRIEELIRERLEIDEQESKLKEQQLDWRNFAIV